MKCQHSLVDAGHTYKGHYVNPFGHKLRTPALHVIDGGKVDHVVASRLVGSGLSERVCDNRICTFTLTFHIKGEGTELQVIQPERSDPADLSHPL